MKDLPRFKLTLFGGFQLFDDQGTLIDPGPRKVKAMLSWLALNPDLKHPREKVAALFWPDSEIEVARHSLRQALGSLRKVMPDEIGPLQATKDWILLESSRIEVDVHAFNRALAQGEFKASEAISDLYRGELLEGCNPRADLFEDWLADHRNHYRERATNAMCQRLSCLIDRKSFKAAIPHAMKLITIDPLRESAYRGLIMAHMGLGNHALALRWYRRCERILLDELGVLPCLETRALHARLLSSWNEQDEDKQLQQQQVQNKKRAHNLVTRDTQRVLYQAGSAFDAIMDQLGGQSILIRGESSRASGKLLGQIVQLAEYQGFQVCRAEISVPGEGASGQARLKLLTYPSSYAENSDCRVDSSHSLRRQLEGYVNCMQSTVQTSPLLLILENIHAAGTRTLEKIGRLVSSVGQASVLLVMTSRYNPKPVEQAWQGALVNAPLTTIDLA